MFAKFVTFAKGAGGATPFEYSVIVAVASVAAIHVIYLLTGTS